jgi:hypothetical protein
MSFLRITILKITKTIYNMEIIVNLIGSILLWIFVARGFMYLGKILFKDK